MINPEAKNWVPENYLRFAQVNRTLERYYELKTQATAGMIAVSIGGGLIQRPEFSIVAAATAGIFYFLLNPSSRINIPGNRLFREQQRLGQAIAGQHGWLAQAGSDRFIIERIKSTLKLASELSPIHSPLEKDLTPEQAIAAFNSRFELESQKFRVSQNWRNITISIARDALNLSEIYWDKVETNEEKPYADAIKNRRAALTREQHMGYQ